ncbi:MAG: hypothetical protein QXU01_01875 [Candidatus Hadarchaeales archaeon]
MLVEGSCRLDPANWLPAAMPCRSSGVSPAMAAGPPAGTRSIGPFQDR